ncbi:hypothetical protein F5Y15DRAFT_417661 [Xylariaceae sp. FL0016]|nr:hypothetical protein F5Y15DRAFT_417661 [Xylariaceae sp. FL0016]
MYPKLAFFTAALLSQVLAVVGLFSCHGVETAGFAPKCCRDMNGQVGINCISAHRVGYQNPIWECNVWVYNITGCCQSIGYKNPYNNITLDLRSTSIDP